MGKFFSQNFWQAHVKTCLDHMILRILGIRDIIEKEGKAVPADMFPRPEN